MHTRVRIYHINKRFLNNIRTKELEHNRFAMAALKLNTNVNIFEFKLKFLMEYAALGIRTIYYLFLFYFYFFLISYSERHEVIRIGFTTCVVFFLPVNNFSARTIATIIQRSDLKSI